MNVSKYKMWGVVAIWFIAFQVICALMGYVTEMNLVPWYAALPKSSLTPPGIVFGIVWPILYVLLAILGARIFTQSTHCSSQIKKIYILQLLLNFAWTPLFFGLHWVGVACIELIMLCLLSFYLLILLSREGHSKLMLLLLPYSLWIAFATYLNIMVWYLSA